MIHFRKATSLLLNLFQKLANPLFRIFLFIIFLLSIALSYPRLDDPMGCLQIPHPYKFGAVVISLTPDNPDNVVSV